jgi:NAD-dependent dihydropyrimidine dehydrogenase PreA subunit
MEERDGRLSMSVLEFEVRSGGTIRIDLEKCKACETKACVKICNTTGMGGILELKDGLPALKPTLEEVKRGACTEDLACELDCELYGKKAIVVSLPLPELDEYLKGLSEKPIYAREA